jgi:hypothetical protein
MSITRAKFKVEEAGLPQAPAVRWPHAQSRSGGSLHRHRQAHGLANKQLSPAVW